MYQIMHAIHRENFLSSEVDIFTGFLKKKNLLAHGAEFGFLPSFFLA